MDTSPLPVFGPPQFYYRPSRLPRVDTGPILIQIPAEWKKTNQTGAGGVGGGVESICQEEGPDSAKHKHKTQT